MERSETDKSFNKPQKKYIELIEGCRDMALVHLSSQMDEMFDNIEPALMDFTEKAESNQLQLRFIEAINILKSNREHLEKKFRYEITRGFDEFLEGSPISYPIAVTESQADETLELVDKKELDKYLAVQNMVTKFSKEWYQQLYALSQRLGMVRGGEKIDECDIPASPPHTASSFQITAQELKFETQVLLVVYALFEKFVLNAADTIYDDFNSRLADAGIFPNLKLKFTAPQTAGGAGADSDSPEEAADAESGVTDQAGTQAQSGQAAQGEGMSAALGQELFQSIQNMLAVRRMNEPGYTRPGTGTDGGSVAMADKPVLVSAISSLQPQHSASYLPGGGEDTDRPANVEIDMHLMQHVKETLVAEREKLFSEIDKSTIPTADLDTIELVGMLFDQMLDEPELSNIAKALISHLHTPYLKIAILDRDFLINHQHIARKLLDLMVDSGKRWIDEDDLRRGIYYPMQDAVNHILADFVDDFEIFQIEIDNLTNRIATLEQKAKVVEARTQEAAKGRERLETARKRATEAIIAKLDGRRLHPALERFLRRAWLDKLILMTLRDPNIEQTKDWRDALTVVDTVIWAYGARNDQSVRRQLKERIADLKLEIETGLISLGNYHQSDIQACFEILDAYLEQDPQKVAEEPESTEPFADIAEETAPEPVLSKEQLTDEVKEMTEELRKTDFGTWFQLEDQNQNPRTLKLSWFSPITRKCMFVDKSGMQAVIIPIEELAAQICAKRANVITSPKGPFVNRALRSIRSVLERTLGLQEATS